MTDRRDHWTAAIVGVALVTGSAGAVGAQPSAAKAAAQGATSARSAELSASQEAERMRAARRADARDIDAFVPYYSVKDGIETALFLMSKISDPVAVAVSALGDSGAALPLGEYVIEPLQHLEIPLAERLRGFEESFSTGALRLSFLGDPDTLQGWAVVSAPSGQRFEIPVAIPEEAGGRDLSAFWSLTEVPGLAGSQLSVHLVNTSGRSLRVDLVVEEEGRTETASFIMEPDGRVRLEGTRRARFGPRGSLRLRHDGDPGDLAGVGLVESPAARGPVAATPLYEVETLAKSSRYESMPFTMDAATGPERRGAWLELFNPGDTDLRVVIEALAASGDLLGTNEWSLRAGEVASLSVARAFPTLVGRTDPVRLRVRAAEGAMLVRGWGVLESRELVDVTYFDFADAHGQGTYPLPEVTRYETLTTLVNLGEEDATILGQVYWDGGTYSFGPFTVSAGGSYVIDLEELVQSGEPDMLGRRLDALRPGGVLKWTSSSGSREFIARTTSRPRGSQDRFGFNCFGCCWESPFGVIIPGEVAFTPGESRSFEAGVRVETCSGTMGPFPTTPEVLTVPVPFSWDGEIVTSNEAADADIAFEDRVQATRITDCTAFLKWVFGVGRAKMCKLTFNPRCYNARETCTSQTSFCLECKACCHNLYQETVCKGKDPHLRDQERNLCLTNCDTDSCAG